MVILTASSSQQMPHIARGREGFWYKQEGHLDVAKPLTIYVLSEIYLLPDIHREPNLKTRD